MERDLPKLGIWSAWAAAGGLLLVGICCYAVTGRTEVFARYLFSLGVVAALLAAFSGLALTVRMLLRR